MNDTIVSSAALNSTVPVPPQPKCLRLPQESFREVFGLPQQCKLEPTCGTGWTDWASELASQAWTSIGQGYSDLNAGVRSLGNLTYADLQTGLGSVWNGTQVLFNETIPAGYKGLPTFGNLTAPYLALKEDNVPTLDRVIMGGAALASAACLSQVFDGAKEMGGVANLARGRQKTGPLGISLLVQSKSTQKKALWAAGAAFFAALSAYEWSKLPAPIEGSKVSLFELRLQPMPVAQ